MAEVKVLGVLAMIDDGETDWKVFCIRVDDPLAGCINDVEDIDRELPVSSTPCASGSASTKSRRGSP